jgi:hypothetical protein
MGLDLYVGPLTRYYVGDWETIVQRIGREKGWEVSMRRPNEPKRSWFARILDHFRPRGTAAAAKAVERWRERLRKQLQLASLQWNEDPDAEYETDKPAWDCYGALVLWAAYDELSAASRRETADGWEQDPAYLTSLRNHESRYRHLIGDTQIWLPIQLDAPVLTQDVTGQSVTVGSSAQLFEELKQLNSRTWRATDQQISQWRHDGAEYGCELEISARFGFSVFYELARRSVAARLPMKLDY